MRVTDPKKFKRRVQVPLSFPLYALGAYIALFMNIFLYGQPITLIVSGALVISGVAIATYEPTKKKQP
jgi:hypothetical protein